MMSVFRATSIVLSLIATSTVASAWEMTTSCPSAKPGKAEVRFRYGEIWPQGYRTQFEESKATRKDDLTYLEFNLSSYISTKAVLMCEFKDRSSIEIPIPGLLHRCGMTLRNYDSKKKPLEWLDVWCISDDAQVPAPGIK